MIAASQIAGLKTASIDFDETEQLISKLAQLRRERKDFFLTKAEFDEILRWKLRGQYGRQRALRASNTDELIRAITGLALTIKHSDKNYELELRVRLLCALRGIGVPVASAVLAMVYPQEYAVIDFRVWRQIFDEERSVFSVANYRRYMREIRGLARELGWTVQAVDLAIWEYDRNMDTLTQFEGREGEHLYAESVC